MVQATANERIQARGWDLYKAYGDAANWVTSTGEPIPQWNQVDSTVKALWVAVAHYAVNQGMSLGVDPGL